MSKFEEELDFLTHLSSWVVYSRASLCPPAPPPGGRVHWLQIYHLTGIFMHFKIATFHLFTQSQSIFGMVHWFYIHVKEQLASFYTHSMSLHNSKCGCREKVLYGGTRTEKCTGTTTLLYEEIFVLSERSTLIVSTSMIFWILLWSLARSQRGVTRWWLDLMRLWR